ncbi:exosome complex component RRP46 [Parasteatoda tepidariorum]|uniref:exosome complex component RRP46 n=1 Tax=Parasteatoda tepidariorum TaxID=114398 RepID=UPI001C7202E8|nr:exosome complex component RRP46 [Parasteatoda tepidariorum]
MHALQFSNLSRADGSVIFSTGETVIQAAAYGPTEIKISKELYDKAAIEVIFNPKVGQSGCEERVIENFVRSSLEPMIIKELHPRSSITVIIQEMQNAGNLLACCVNAAYLAVLDAGIPLRGSIAAVSIDLSDDKLTPFNSSKEKEAQSCTVCITNEMKINGIKSSFFLTKETIEKCIKTAQSSAENIFKMYRDGCTKRYNSK